MKMNIILAVLAVLLLGTITSTGYFFSQYQASQQQLEKLKKDPSLLAKDGTKSLVDDVRKLMDLPTDEEPTIATITDITKLQSQAFFAKGKNGDRVIIYLKAKKAILYDPVAGKIIEVAPISLPTPTPLSSLPSITNASPSGASRQLFQGNPTPSLTPTIKITPTASPTSTFKSPIP